MILTNSISVCGGEGGKENDRKTHWICNMECSWMPVYRFGNLQFFCKKTDGVLGKCADI